MDRAAPATRRTRHLDPQRRERILAATIDCLAEYGVARTTHRLIATHAGVPPASLTYHYATLADLRREAFEHYTAAQTALLDELTESVDDVDGLVDALVTLVHRGGGTTRHAAVGVELYLAALRDPALRSVTRAWTAASRRTYARFLPGGVAADLDALLEGLILHTLLDADTDPDPDRTRATLRQALAGWQRTDPAGTVTTSARRRPAPGTARR